MPFFNRNNNGNKSNKKISSSPWAKPGNNDGNDGGNNNGNGGNNPPANNGNTGGNQQTAEERQQAVREFMRKSGLYEGIDMQGFMQAVEKGDAEQAGAIFARAMENAVHVSTVAAQRLLSSQESKLRDELTSSTRTSMQNDMARQQMRDDLPFTQDEALAPIAEQVLDGFLQQGLSVREAIGKTGDYFKETAQVAGSHFGMRVEEPTDRRPGSRPFSDSRGQGFDNNDNGDSFGDEDWVSTLTFGARHAGEPLGGNQGTGADNGNSGDGNADSGNNS